MVIAKIKNSRKDIMIMITKKIKLMVFFIGLSFPILGGTALANDGFQQLCQASGVQWCNGFDTEQEVTSFAGSGWGQNSTTPSWDTSTKFSGPGSLKFEYRGQSGSGGAGQWARSLGKDFGENSTFYLMYRLRYSPEAIGGAIANSGTGMKQHILSHSTATCNNVEITMVNMFSRGYPTLYSRCGAESFRVYHEPFGGANYWDQWSPIYNGSTGQIPDGDFNKMTGVASGSIACHYGQGYQEPECKRFKSNQWMTFYFEVHIGNWGSPNSSVRAWMADEGEELQQFIDLKDHIFRTGGTAIAYNTLTLHMYMSFKNDTVPHPTAYAWYDEVIVSSQPINGIGGGTPPEDLDPPSPPDNLVIISN